MIVVCERLSSGRVYQQTVLQTVDQALIIARIMRQDLHRAAWIERDDQPASLPTLEARARRLLRWSRPRGTH